MNFWHKILYDSVHATFTRNSDYIKSAHPEFVIFKVINQKNIQFQQIKMPAPFLFGNLVSNHKEFKLFLMALPLTT